ncbi:CHAT domain-containing protein [Dactylosporangium sp. NPDC050688]|uniref:CHAT domain-containing protein n=1 Tax=Dactylosporangium sp. NPDC050688 TaxID=3157217 RepID=UPI0034039EB7
MTLPRLLVTFVPWSPTPGWTVSLRFAGTDADVGEPFDVPAVDIDGASVPAGGRSAAEIQVLLDAVIDPDGDADPVGYGRWLFDVLFGDGRWAVVLERPEVRAARGVELALRWPSGAAALHRLIWEAMHDGDGPLAAHPTLLVAVTRLVIARRPPDSPLESVTAVPTLLLAAGAKLSDKVIRPGAMFMGLVRAFESDSVCSVHVSHEVTASRLAADCRRLRPHIVHLVAHGRPGVVMLAPEGPHNGQITADVLVRTIAGGQAMPSALILSACHTAEPPFLADRTSADGPMPFAPFAAQAVEAGLPVVVAMNGAVSEQASRLYTRRLLHAIHRGEPIVEAAAHGRRAALLGLSDPLRRLDWAMPVLFMAEHAPADYAPISPASTDRIADLADSFKFRQRPVFIGYFDLLAMTDQLFAAESHDRLGFIGIHREGPIDRLGGTRVLQEMGYRLLQQGHLPIMIGPYQEQSGPQDLRAWIAAVHRVAVRYSNKFDLPPVPPSVLHADGGRWPDVAAFAAAVAMLPLPLARKRIIEAVGEFARPIDPIDPIDRRDPLDPTVALDLLCDDLNRLATAVGSTGAPFGPHTRPVLLGDRVHDWGSALDDLLSVIDADGIGRPGRPVPVVVTASTVGGRGAIFKAWRDEEAGPRKFAFPRLEPLPEHEAALGFLWVLLHPWRTTDESFLPVYTPMPKCEEGVLNGLAGGLRGYPAKVRAELYLSAATLVGSGQMRTDDDSGQYLAYRAGHP